MHIPIDLVLVMAVNDTFGSTEETILLRELPTVFKVKTFSRMEAEYCGGIHI